MIDVLRDGRAGTAVLPGDAGWGENPPLYVSPGDPAAIVRPETPEQVAAAVRFAASEGIGVGIRSGGHGGAHFDNDGGLVIELSNFKDIDVLGSTVRIGAGSTWGEVATELGRHNLGISSGDTKSVGVGGLTLGGGIGWLVREYGLALDSLVAAEVVLASGEIVTASADEHPDLFWALRGGGGNFGVVTTFVFEAHPLDGVVFGTLSYDVAESAAVLKAWRDIMRAAPEQFNSSFLSMPAMGPGMAASAQVIILRPGRDVAAVEPQLTALRGLPGYLSEDISVRDYVDALDDPRPFEGPAPTITGDNGFAADLGDAAIDALVAAHQSLAASVIMVRYLRGAFNRVPADATAWGFRDAEVMLMLAAFLPPGASRDQVDGAGAAWLPVLPHTVGTYGKLCAGCQRADDRTHLSDRHARAAARGEAQLRSQQPAQPQPQRRAVVRARRQSPRGAARNTIAVSREAPMATTVTHTDHTFVDADGVTIHYYVWDAPTPKAILQLTHGLGDHALRYEQVAQDFVRAGYTVYADDHRGHGQTGLQQNHGDATKLGRLGPGGLRATVRDVREFTSVIKKDHPGVPVVLLGHSWGSLMAQMVLNTNAADYDAAVLTGTAYRTLADMNGGDLNAKHKHLGTTGNEWLSRDPAVAQQFKDDPLTFYAAAMKLFGIPDALRLLGRPARDLGKDIPLLIMIGSEDTLGGEKSIAKLAAAYVTRSHLSDVHAIVYPGARHEIFNETNRDEVIGDLVTWLDERVAHSKLHRARRV